MASVNKVILIGNLGADPELRTFPSGGQICNIRIATSEKWKDRQSGELREHTEWHNIVFSDRLAEIASQYLRKGSPVYIEGRLRTRKWQDQSGQDRYITEVRADVLQMLGSRGDTQSGGYSSGGRTAPAYPQNDSASSRPPASAQRTPEKSTPSTQNFGADPFNDDDIPF